MTDQLCAGSWYRNRLQFPKPKPELTVKKEMFADTVLLVVGAKDTVKGAL